MGLFRKKSNEDKGLHCSFDEEGNEVCQVMNRHKNRKLSTGSSFSIEFDEQCRTKPRDWSVFSDDESIVQRKLKQAEAECRRNKVG